MACIKNLCNLILIANVFFFQCSTFQCPKSLFFDSLFFPIFFCSLNFSNLICLISFIYFWNVFGVISSLFSSNKSNVKFRFQNEIRCEKTFFFEIVRFNLLLAIRPIIISKLTCCLETDRVKQNEFLLEFKFLAFLLDIHTCIATLPSCSITKSTLFSTEELNTRTLA